MRGAVRGTRSSSVVVPDPASPDWAARRPGSASRELGGIDHDTLERRAPVPCVLIPSGGLRMCRNIRPLFNFEPAATEDEIRDAALQYVRKISGMRSPSQANLEIFDRAVEEIARSTRQLVESLETRAAPRDREEERRKKQAKWREREARIAAKSAAASGQTA